MREVSIEGFIKTFFFIPYKNMKSQKAMISAKNKGPSVMLFKPNSSNPDNNVITNSPPNRLASPSCMHISSASLHPVHIPQLPPTATQLFRTADAARAGVHADNGHCAGVSRCVCLQAGNEWLC